MYNNTIMKPLGTCTVAVFNPKNSKTYQIEFVVVDDDQSTPILGNPAMQQMDLVRVQHQNIRTVNTEVQRGSQGPLSMEEVLKEYPDVFQGAGKLKGQYKLKIEENAMPVVHPPRRVPVALKGKLKRELERLQSLWIIEKVIEPTPWVSSLVIVQKPNGQNFFCVCLDPKDLNKVLRRSHYPTSTVEDILPELSRAKVFSTMDAMNCFWNVELDDDSSRLTTFNSPFRRFCWRRLPFGLCSTPEEFQRRLNHALDGLTDVLTIHDDILSFGEGSAVEEARTDHDNNFHSNAEVPGVEH